MERIKLVVVSASDSILPLNSARGIQFQYPVVPAPHAVFGLVARNIGPRTSAKDVAPIGGLLERVEKVAASTTDGFLPLDSACGIQFQHPVVFIAPAVFGFVARSVGSGISAEDVATIGGLFDGTKIVAAAAADGFLPSDSACGIQFYNPIVINPHIVFGFVARNIGAGGSAEDISSIRSLLQ